MGVGKFIAIGASALLLASCATTSVKSAVDEDATDSNHEKKNTDNNAYLVEALDDFTKTIHNTDLKVTQTPSTPTKGKPFTSPFVVTAAHADGTPQSSFSIMVTYPISRENDTIHFATAKITTEKDGKASFMPDIPKYSFDSTITFTPALPACFVDANNPPYGDGTAADAAQGGQATSTAANIVHLAMTQAQDAAVSAKYRVITDMAQDGGMIYVWDYGENGKPLVNSSFFLKEIMAYGVRGVGNSPFSSASQLNKSDDELYRIARGYIQKGFMIYGTVKYDSPVAPLQNGNVFCSLTASLKCVDLATGKMLYVTDQRCQVTGANKAQAIDSCRKELAKIAARAIMYGM